jgi:hypothetical protein
MPPSIHFDHSSVPYLNTALLPSGPFKVGQATDIAISLLNDGDVADAAKILLWWSGPNAGSPQGTHMDLVSQLALPFTGNVTMTVAQKTGSNPGTGQVTVSWTPRAADFPSSMGASIHGCLFAQAEVQPIAIPPYPGDFTADNNWDPSYRLCAQHNIDVVTVSPPPPSPKPTKSIQYALGVGHGLTTTVDALVSVERIPGDDPAFIRYLDPLRKALRMNGAGRVLRAADAGLTLGSERLLVPQKRDGKVSVRLGHTGELSPAEAKKLTGGKRTKSLKLSLAAGELRQAIVDITPPKGAKRGDCFAVNIVNEVAPAPTTARTKKAKPRRILGALTLIVQIA